jgi:nicotinate phosphoribosyltransferase
MQTKHNQEKIQGLREIGVKCSEFGTRRRHSFAVHNNFLSDVAEYGRDVFTGTSNVFLAMEYNMTPIGTQAHQWTQYHAAQYGYRMANYMAMENWVNVYNGNLGIALPDTFTTEVFLRSFDPKFAKLHDGGRQDSGDPIAFTNMWVDHYRKLRINPTYKSIIYSDSLKDHETIARIHHHAQHQGINDGYGIGTWCTNDVGQLPLNIVIKMTGCKAGGMWVPTVKLSDDVGKNTGESDEIANCKKQLRIQE